MSNEIRIDLARVTSSSRLFGLMDQTFEFGGGPYAPYEGAPGTGWGGNWSALKDCLCYLDSGGIWGTSTKIIFPLKLRFLNHAGFARLCKPDFDTFVEILEAVRDTYSKGGMSFQFSFD